MTSPIRLRAIRAAQVASLSVGLVSVVGCPTTDANPDTESHHYDAFLAGDASVTVDAFAALDGGNTPDAHATADTGTEGDASVGDASVGDAEVLADAGVASDAAMADAATGDCEAFPPLTKACCEMTPGGYWDETDLACYVAVPGPFVPPTMNA